MDASFRSLLAAAIEACVGIVRARKGPEDIPASAMLLSLSLVGAALLTLAHFAMPSVQARGNVFVLIALDLGIWLAAVRLVLQFAGTPERFLQTATAIFGCQLVLAPVLLTSNWLLLAFHRQPGVGQVVSVLSVAVMVWVLVIVARILRSATGWPMFHTVLLAFSIEALNTLIYLAIYPLPADVAPAT